MRKAPARRLHGSPRPFVHLPAFLCLALPLAGVACGSSNPSDAEAGLTTNDAATSVDAGKAGAADAAGDRFVPGPDAPAGDGPYSSDATPASDASSAGDATAETSDATDDGARLDAPADHGAEASSRDGGGDAPLVEAGADAGAAGPEQCVHRAAVNPKWTLVWSDEFDKPGAPDPSNWGFEQGFVRNEELQWYQPNNATVANGLLTIAAQRQQVANP